MLISKTPGNVRQSGMLYPEMKVYERVIGNTIQYSAETYIRIERDGKYYLVPILFRDAIPLPFEEKRFGLHEKFLDLVKNTTKAVDNIHKQAYMIRERFIIQDKDEGRMWILDDNSEPERERFDDMK